jgi:hypothetical protein
MTRTSPCREVGAKNPASSGPIQASRICDGSGALGMTALLGGSILPRTTRNTAARRSADERDDPAMTLVFDLALYTAKEGRSRALDRYARTSSLPPGSDEVRMLDAMRHACFSIWRIERPHKTTGLIITDVLREEAWLVDENLETGAPKGMALAARLCEPESFAMTCSAIVPLNRNLIEEVTLDALVWRRSRPEQVAQDPRFAIALYRAAIDSGIMDRVTYE